MVNIYILWFIILFILVMLGLSFFMRFLFGQLEENESD